MSSNIIIFIIAISIILIIYVTTHIIKTKYESLVQSTSPRLNAIEKLYQKYDFYPSDYCKMNFITKVNSKTSFDRFNFDSYLEDVINENYIIIAQHIKCARSNRKNQTLMMEEYNSLPNLAQIGDDIVKGHIYSLYHQFERQMVAQAENKLKPIMTIASFTCIVSYTSPQGRNSYSRKKNIP